MVYRSQRHKIGNVREAGLADAIDRYDRHCTCDSFKLRRKSNADPTGDERLLNLELSLACQAACAMCCVGAPEQKGSYDLYQDLTRLVRSQRPDRIIVQGGEILIQKRSVEWVRAIKREWPGLRVGVVTNGNVDATQAPEMAALFDSFVVSYVGFQPDTYRTIMNLDIRKTLAFTRALLDQRHTDVTLKFLLTPINLHEAAAFLEEAARLGPKEILIADSNVPAYVEPHTADHFWSKIVDRAARSLKSAIVSHKESLRNTATTVRFEPAAARLLDVDDSFVKSNRLESCVSVAG